MNTPVIDPVMHSRLAQRLSSMISEADRMLHDASVKGNQEYDAARDRLLEQIQQARHDLSQAEGKLLEKAREAARSGDRVVREHPYAVVGAVAGLAVLVGWLWGRK